MGWTTEELWFDSWQGQEIFLLSKFCQRALGPTQPPIQWAKKVFVDRHEAAETWSLQPQSLVVGCWITDCLTNQPTNRPTPWSRVILEKLTVSQLVTKLPPYYGTQRFIAAYTTARHLSLSWARSIRCMPHPTSWRSFIILSSLMYNEQTNAYLTDVLLYCSLFIAATFLTSMRHSQRALTRCLLSYLYVFMQSWWVKKKTCTFVV